MKNPLTLENTLHAAGIGVTALAAHTAVGYLQTYAPDYPTALGFSLAISAAVFGGWTVALHNLRAEWKMAIAAIIMAAVSGYTVYEAGMIPLKQAAIDAAAETDKPRLAEHTRQMDQYKASRANYQQQLEDLRNQNMSSSTERAAIKDGKGAAWKRNKLQEGIDLRNSEIQTLIGKQNDLTAPGEFEPTQPQAIPAEQRYPILARAFAFELIAIMFMVFAAKARKATIHRRATEAADLDASTERANRAIRTLQTLFAHADQCANESFARANECANAAEISPTPEMTSEEAFYLLKSKLIDPEEGGNITTETLMKKGNFGRRKAKRILEESASKGILSTTPAGRGFTYRYPKPATTNVIQYPINRSA